MNSGDNNNVMEIFQMFEKCYYNLLYEETFYYFLVCLCS